MRTLLALIALVLTSATASAEVSRYTIQLVGNTAGSMVIDRAGPTERHIEFAFNDRGRGPDIEASYQLDDRGIPRQISVSGVDYFKAPVTETLTTQGGRLIWTSGADHGDTAEAIDPEGASGSAFYVTLDGPIGELELLVGALAQAPDQALDLLPLGRARLETVSEQVFSGGVALRLVEVHGLGFEPEPLWINAQGQLFAVVSGWLTVVQEGGEHLIPELRALQDKRRASRYNELITSATRRPEGRVLIDNARIFDVAAGRVSEATGMVVSGNNIEALLLPTDPRPQDAELIDAAGRTLLPGLWDMHTHIDLADGPLQLAAGVTTVRDLANDHDRITETIALFERGVGPHVFKAGIIDGAGPFAGPTPALVETADDASKWVSFYADNGYDQIKIYSSVPVDVVPAMAAEAKARGLRVSGHVPAGMWAEDAIRAGFDEIQHINMVFLNFYKDIVETRNPDRFIKVAERGADLDPESAPFQRFIQLLRDNDIVVDPTVAVFMNLFRHESGELAPSLQSAQGRLPPQVHRANLKGGLEVPEGWDARYRASADRILDVVKSLHEAGVTLVAGTDGLAGFTYQSELEYYQKAGISPPDILRLATLGSAEVMGVDDRVGQLAPGQRADVILVDGRPDENIGDIENVSWVMKDGRMIDPAAMVGFLSVAANPKLSAWQGTGRLSEAPIARP